MSATNRWRPILPERKRVIMWGAADQARINAHILRELDCDLVALIDDAPDRASPFPGLPLFHGWKELQPWLMEQDAASLGFIAAIGNPYGHVRCRVHDLLTGAGLTPVSLVDATAKLCASAQIGAGVQAMPGAIVHNEAVIARQCLLNTRSLVEHDCVLEEGVEIGPGATLAGRVHVGANSWVATGAVVRPRVRIGRNTIIGAGAVVVSDIPEGVVAVGVPAKPMANRVTPSADIRPCGGSIFIATK
jgi:sugar O-acyltransferase (sialic acid O-acetyltransferase NeuD family)